jgi:hypothetical protein
MRSSGRLSMLSREENQRLVRAGRDDKGAERDIGEE